MVKLLSPTSLSKTRRRTSPRRKAGGRPKKGSKEAKEMMARVRAAKKGGKGKSTRKMRTPTAVASPVASPVTLSKYSKRRGRKASPKRKSPKRKASPKRKTRGRK